MYLDRYERAGDAPDLERAAALAAVAVESSSPGDDERPGFLNNLANALRIRFKLRLDPLNAELPAEGIDIDISDLNAAIKLYAAALTEPASNPAQVERAMILSNFGDVLFDRADLYELTDEPDKAAAVRHQALAAHEEAIATTPPTAPDRPGRLNKLAVIQAALASRTSAQEDIEAARASFREACETGLQAAPESALAAASNWLAWEAGGRPGSTRSSPTGMRSAQLMCCTGPSCSAPTGRPGSWPRAASPPRPPTRPSRKATCAPRSHD